MLLRGRGRSALPTAQKTASLGLTSWGMKTQRSPAPYTASRRPRLRLKPLSPGYFPDSKAGAVSWLRGTRSPAFCFAALTRDFASSPGSPHHPSRDLPSPRHPSSSSRSDCWKCSTNRRGCTAASAGEFLTAHLNQTGPSLLSRSTAPFTLCLGHGWEHPQTPAHTQDGASPSKLLKQLRGFLPLLCPLSKSSSSPNV